MAAERRARTAMDVPSEWVHSQRRAGHKGSTGRNKRPHGRTRVRAMGDFNPPAPLYLGHDRRDRPPQLPRHPEKAHRPDQEIPRKPDWIRVKAPVSREYAATRAIVREHNLHTVCEEAACPNIGECWTKRHATMMIMGDTCTRACAFCNVKTGLPGALDADEPANVARGGEEAGPEACGDHLGGSRRSGRWRRGAFRRR